MRADWSVGFRSVVSAIVGIVGAIVAVEFGLRPFTTPNVPPEPRVAADSLVQDTLVARQMHEGVSEARFSVGGARLTGNPPIPGAPTVVILGDSYVEARAIADTETMGSRFERQARASGDPVNVRQYGWVGASPARYLLVAETVRHRWAPRDIVVVLSDNDLDGKALYGGAPPSVRVTRDGSIVPFPASVADAVPVVPLRWTLQGELRERTWEFRARISRLARLEAARGPAPTQSPADAAVEVLPDSVQLAMLPDAVIRSLAGAIGPRLAVLYLAGVRLTGDDTMPTTERRLLAACRAAEIRCASTRDGMIAARAEGVIANGFWNTTPGNGHLNAAGHEIVALALWNLLRRSAPHRAQPVLAGAP